MAAVTRGEIEVRRTRHHDVGTVAHRRDGKTVWRVDVGLSGDERPRADTGIVRLRLYGCEQAKKNNSADCASSCWATECEEMAQQKSIPDNLMRFA